MQLFYSHGFHSSRNCLSYLRICEGLKVSPIQLIYDNGADFRENLFMLKNQLLDSNPSKHFGFIGNSLGAFYLWQLMLYSSELKIPMPSTFIFFNPVFEPLAQLKKYIDIPQINTTTQDTFTLTRANWESYAHYLCMPLSRNANRQDNHISKSIENNIDKFSEYGGIVCFSYGDKLIDWHVSQAYWKNHANILHIQGDHVIVDFTPLLESIRPFLFNK
ncbi:hypothetical protein LS73_007030 [Helicobacter muridarum]|uniref:Predicted esterase n=1 Tax=Helicobacter muridarum TaxID=216 RepID=A0A099TVU3_9HELI|nr:YqiA/YcfP family alpha/beta fold hydrolase [Helicobacter muridarum]TLD99615.1 hypothetical protein LS73_007030 [Helicobacter muridarum]STQ86773.1 Predicted esterase [Helicobacter muridarum]